MPVFEHAEREDTMYRTRLSLLVVIGGAAVAILDSDGHTQDEGCAEAARGLRRNRSYQPAVGEAPGANFNGLE